MSERYEALVWKESKNGKKFAVRIGSALPRDDGGFQVYLDALPLPDANGTCCVTVSKPREKSGSGTPF